MNRQAEERNSAAALSRLSGKPGDKPVPDAGSNRPLRRPLAMQKTLIRP
jgi:hypothetical protein